MTTKGTAGFTPGPWRVAERDRWPGNSPICPVREIMRDVEFVPGHVSAYKLAEVQYPTSMSDTVGAIERLANARLIAAAPDLYAALRRIAKFPESREDEMSIETAREMARAAIASVGQ